MNHHPNSSKGVPGVSVLAAMTFLMLIQPPEVRASQAMALTGQNSAARPPGAWTIRVTAGFDLSATGDQGVLLRKPDHVGNAVIGFRSEPAGEIGIAYELGRTYMSRDADVSFALRAGYQWSDVDFGTDTLLAGPFDPLDPSSYEFQTIQLGTGRREMMRFGLYMDRVPNGEDSGWILGSGIVFGPVRFSGLRVSGAAFRYLDGPKFSAKAGFVVGWDLEGGWRFGASGWSAIANLTLTMKGIEPEVRIETGSESILESGVARSAPHLAGVTLAYTFR